MSARLDEFDFGCVFGFDPAYFVGCLQVQPEMFGCSKKARQTNGSIRADATAF
jgi:hypothetical protein